MKIDNTNYNEYEFDDFVFDDSFISYANNKNQSDILKWEKWLSDDPENKKTALDAKILLQHFDFKNKELSGDFINNEWLKLSNRLNISETTEPVKKISVYRNKSWQLAGVFTLAVIFVIAFLYFTSTPECEEFVDFHEIIVPRGEIKKTELPDGSIVFLNADSKLIYDQCYGVEQREVYLDGEASFDVKHIEGIPFTVNTEENVITVLGTAFNVYAHNSENIFRASLERGKISISHYNEEVVELVVNQTYQLNRNSNEATVFETADVESFSSWKNGDVVFSNLQFKDILKKLERSHNVTFNLQNQMVGMSRFTGTFTTDDDITTILGIIKLTTNFEYEIVEDTVIIK
jgi:ferric-dicitrate binding protein FerR (iron transport regulator)